MLKLINLYIIEQIFSEIEVNISQRSKMLYINCLIYYFKGKKASVQNAVAFDINFEEFGNFQKYLRLFEQLENAGLVHIGADKVAFNNMWGKFINSNDLEKVSPDEYVGSINFSGVDKYENDIKSNQSIKELSQMKYGISSLDVDKLIDIFILEQKTFEKKYTSYSDCIKHFTFWLPSNAKRLPQEKIVKSKGKILGYE